MTAAPLPSGISVRGVSKNYGATRVFADLTCDFAPNTIYGLVGINGAGKTTLMSVICGHAFATSGDVFVDGTSALENADALAKLCFVRENQLYPDHFNALNVLSTAKLFYPSWADDVEARLLERFRLPLKTKSKKLSRGQRSALAIIISLASRTPYTFLDEPYLGLDPAARTIFYEELAREYAEHPRTFVISTHLIDEAANLFEEVYVIHDQTFAAHLNIGDAESGGYVVSGPTTAVRAFASGKNVLHERTLGAMAAATIEGEATDGDQAAALAAGVTLAPATIQELVAALGLHDARG